MIAAIRIRRSGLFAWALMAALPAQAMNTAQRTVDVVADATGRLRPVIVAADRGIGAASYSYWADPQAHKILRTAPRSPEIEEVASGLNTPYGLGFDQESQRFLWTSSGSESVQMLIAGTHEVITLNSSFEQPPALEMAREGGKEAITVVGDDIVRVSEDATSGDVVTQVLMHVDASEGIHGLALDADGHLYVGNAVGMMAYKLRLADSAVTRLIFTDHVPPTPDPDLGEPQ